MGWQSRPVARQALNQRRDVCAAEAGEGQCRHSWLSDPWRAELRSEGQDQQHRVSSRPLDELIDEFARRRVDPMQIFENHHHRLPAQDPIELAQQRCGVRSAGGYRSPPGTDSSSAISPMSALTGLLCANMDSNLSSLVSASSFRSNPATCSSWAITG